MLSPSLPPVRSSTTRLRLNAPCARARSDRNAGAAKLIVNAATPSFKKARRVIMVRISVGPRGSGLAVAILGPSPQLAPSPQPLHELVLSGSKNEMREPG